jgi:hypothetical protein
MGVNGVHRAKKNPQKNVKLIFTKLRAGLAGLAEGSVIFLLLNCLAHRIF